MTVSAETHLSHLLNTVWNNDLKKQFFSDLHLEKNDRFISNDEKYLSVFGFGSLICKVESD